MNKNHIDTLKEIIYEDRNWLQDTYQDPDLKIIQSNINNRGQAAFYLDSEHKYVILVKTPKAFKKIDYQKIVSSIDKYTVENVIVITNEKPSTDTKKILQELLSQYITIETFRLNELAKNLSKNKLVPKHEIIHDEDKIQQILEKNNITSKSSLSMILTSDYMSRHLYAQKGDLMRIFRDDGVVYRHVVDA